MRSEALPDRRRTLPITASRRSEGRGNRRATQIGGNDTGGRVLPVVQRALRYLGDEPLPRLLGDGIESGGRRVLRIRPHPDDVRKVQRVVVPPLLGDAEL